LLTGAYYFLAKLSSYLTFKYHIHFLKVTSYSGEKQIEVIYEKNALMPYQKEKHVVFIDELIDTGKTMNKILEMIPWAKTCACLTKGKKSDFHGCDFIPNAWLIGFGLDDNGEKRGYPHLLCKHMDAEAYRAFREKLTAYIATVIE
jgi:hypoxanthine phosphoribosyltransferase